MFLTIVVACPTVTYWPDKFAGPGQSIRTQWVVFMSIGCSACHVNDTMDHCLFSSRHANETVPLCLLSVVSWYLERWHVACKLLWSGSQSGKKCVIALTACLHISLTNDSCCTLISIQSIHGSARPYGLWATVRYCKR